MRRDKFITADAAAAPIADGATVGLVGGGGGQAGPRVPHRPILTVNLRRLRSVPDTRLAVDQ